MLRVEETVENNILKHQSLRTAGCGEIPHCVVWKVVLEKGTIWLVNEKREVHCKAWKEKLVL